MEKLLNSALSILQEGNRVSIDTLIGDLQELKKKEEQEKKKTYHEQFLHMEEAAELLLANVRKFIQAMKDGNMSLARAQALWLKRQQVTVFAQKEIVFALSTATTNLINDFLVKNPGEAVKLAPLPLMFPNPEAPWKLPQ